MNGVNKNDPVGERLAQAGFLGWRWFSRHRVQVAVFISFILVVASLVYVPWYARPWKHARSPVLTTWSIYLVPPTEFPDTVGYGVATFNDLDWEKRIDRDRANIQFWLAITVGAGLVYAAWASRETLTRGPS